MDRGCGWFWLFVVCMLLTRAFRVPGVIVALEPGTISPLRAPPTVIPLDTPEVWLVTMARNAAVLGDGGGKETGPPTSGVRPVRPTSGVRPVRKAGWEGSQPPTPVPLPARPDWSFGPLRRAGESGPLRRLPDRTPLPNPQWPNVLGPPGEESEANGGRIGFGVSGPFPTGGGSVVPLGAGDARRAAPGERFPLPSV